MRWAKAGAGLATIGALLTSCDRVGPSIPNADDRGAPMSADASAAARDAAVPQISAAAQAATAELGVQVFWHEVNDEHAVRSNATRLLDYVVGLGANSVGISFPVHTDGARPTRVYVKDLVTPSPESLAIVIGEAKARGLRTMVRPLIDERNIRDAYGSWRGTIKPRNMATWFVSYRDTIMPFLRVAQAAGADVFVLASELDSLVGQVEQWQALRAAAASVFTRRLAYADNWSAWATGRPGVGGIEEGLDAYPPLTLTDSALVAEIAAAWKAWLERRPASVLARTIVQEIGIAATSGAYRRPVAWPKPGQPVMPQIFKKISI